MAKKTPGWWNPDPMDGRSKWHYVTEDGRTLCGKWAHVKGEIEQGNDGSPDNCADCKRRRNEQKIREAA